MTIDIPAEGALARFVVIGGGVGGVALMAAATRTVLRSTAMAWRAGRTATATAWRARRTGTVTLVMRWVVTMRTSGCRALGAIASLGLIPLQHYQYKVNDGMGVYLSGTATCSVRRRLHLLI